MVNSVLNKPLYYIESRFRNYVDVLEFICGNAVGIGVQRGGYRTHEILLRRSVMV